VIVLDASAVVRFLLGLPGALSVEQRIGIPGESLHAPHLMPLEVTQAVLRYEASGQVETARASQAIGDLSDLSVVYYPHEPLLPNVWALRRNLTAYDATYVALSLALGAPLLTFDARLANTPGHGARIELLAIP
jgi:predicted nucleic acid-binding protein